MTNRADVVDVLDLEPTGADSYRGRNLTDSQGVVFGGQLMAQILTAAALTLPHQQVKSVHNLFARGGNPDHPLDLRVRPQHEGRSFGAVAVTVAQDERLCTTALVLMQSPDPDLIRHQAPMPASKGPDLATPKYLSRGWEVRIDDDVDLYDPEAVGPAELNVWSRFSDGPHDSTTSQALLAYASDGFLIGTAMRPHDGIGQSMAHVSISTSVISQTVTFHDDFDAADWHLLAHESPHAGGGRSYGRAHVFAEDGRLVASYEQQNMIRAFAADRRPAPGTLSKY
jgi:acyl-CoA thioesterase